jgi:hypothetical protein
MFKDAAGNDAVTWRNLGKDALESFVVGAVGGHGVSLISQSASVVSRGMNALRTKEEREALVAAARAAGMDELVVANLQASLLSGKYSKKTAQSILENFKIIKQKVNTIPKEMPIREQAVALDLMLERDALNSQIEGVDPALAAPSIERVKEINETLKQIGYAVQESSTESVLQRQQEGTGETGGGREGMGQGLEGEATTQEGGKKEEVKVGSTIKWDAFGNEEVGDWTVLNETTTRGGKPAVELSKVYVEDRVTGKQYTKEYADKNNIVPLADLKNTQETTQEGAKEEIVSVYHGGDLTQQEGNLYVSEDANQARSYAKENKGDVTKFEIPKSKIADEQTVKETLKENGVEVSDEAKLYELIDPRFEETYIGDDAKNNLIDALQQKGFDAAQFTDEDIEGLKKEGVQNIIVFKPESLQQKSIEVKQNRADELFADGYKPIIDGEVKTEFTQQELDDYFNTNETVEMTSAPTQVAPEVTITPETNQTITERINNETDAKKKKVFIAVQKVLSAIPNARIILHENTDSFVDGVAKSSNKTKEDAKNEGVDTIRGAYVNGDVHINLEKAGVTTVFHEALHDLLTKKGIETNAILDMAKGLKSVISDKALKQRLDEFVSEYTEEIDQNKSKEEIEEAKKEEELTKAEEYIVELGAIMAEAQKELSTTKFQQFKTLVNKIAKKLGLPVVFSAASTAQDAVDFMNSMSGKLGRGEQIEGIEPGDGGEVGTFNIPKIKAEKSRSVSEDPRDFIRKFVKDIDIREFNGKKFITNMYDYTNAGETDLGNGLSIYMLGGKNYVPLMMELNGKSIGDVSNLAAFNTKEQAETFIRNSELGGANLFAPHAGTLNQSWQFQQHTFAELFNLVLDNGILTPKELISVFNDAIKDNKENKSQFKQFTEKYGENIKNFDSFKSDPKKIIDLLDIKNNYSPKLRKALNNAIAANKTFQKAIGVNNLNEFYKRIMDPLNEGMTGGEIMNIVEFDPTTFKIVETKPNNTDHHPSFGFTLLAKINGIYQPTELIKSVDITDSYTKYNKGGEEISRKAEEPKFEQKNVSSSAGAIPKTAEFNPKKIKAQKLAPNGKPSNLNDVQWEQVRTPEFKKWFGDWENDPQNASKVVDENGEPLVVYHGSVSTDIDEFDRLKSKKISSGLKEFGTYFTDNIKLAKAYASWAKLNKDEEINIDREINKWKEVRDKARNNKDFESAEYAISMLNESKKGKIYPVFLNLRNIKSFDAKGETNIEAWNNLEVKASYKLAKNRDAMDFLKEGKFGVEKVDGIKAENIVDAFVQDKDIKKELLGNVYLVFDGNASAIKSATENVGTFSAETANIKAQKPSKQDAIQKAKDKYELSVEKRGNSHQQGVTAAIADLQKSDWYAKADDTQRENAEREIKKFFGEKLKSAPSVAKITGKTKDTAVVSDLAAAIRDQIKLEAKAAREATKDINQRRKELGIAIKNVIKNYKGKISEKQLSAINDRISKVNLLNEEMVDRVIDYVDKVMKDADYKEKINKAKSARATIKKLKKDSNRQAEVRAMATAFASIDPDLVEDIDEYMAIAEQVKNALKPTSLSISNTTKFSDIYSYVDQYLEGQENIKKERLLSNNPSLVEQGIIDKSMSLKDIESKIRRINEQKNKLNKATNSEELKDNLKGEINSLKDILKAMVFGYNPVTNERVEMTDRIKQVIKEISSLDVEDMTTEQMIALVESLNNFVKNGTIGGLDAAHKTYVGIKNANDLKRKGFVARQLKAYFSPMLGRLLGFEGMSLNELFTRLFGGVTRGNEFMEKSGVAGVVMGVNKAKKMSNAYQELYANTFKNIKGFFDQENVYERGVLAFVSRTNSIKPEEANKEFNRRIDLLLESYESLKNGTAEEQKMAEVYKKVFDRLNIESRDMSVIESNAKQFNIAGAAWWMGTWENHYQDLYDVSLSIYNTDLGSDFYYTSDRLSKLSESTGESIDITNISERGSSFLINTENEEITDKSKAGVLIASTYPTTLKDKGRYVNLNFDINQSQALSGALVDIETAGAIRQVDAFISSDSFKSIIPNSSDRSLVVNRINKYIRRSKNKLLVPKDYARVIDKVINEAGRFGTTMALGGVFQFILQTFSVGINTLIQAGKNTQLYTGKSFNDWMNSTGTPTANRGVESVTSIENKMNAIDPVKSTLQQVARQYQKLTQFYMKTFLSKPDVFVARAAWKSYYLKYLSDNGYDTKKINWDTWNDTIKEEGIQDLHEKAMLFAENMVSRQQNVSDERLAGETFSSEDGLRKAVRKILLPFAGFSVNQRMRLANDIITLTSAINVASKEDIKIAGRSLVGTVAEQATFNFIKYQVGKLIYYGAMSILGYGDDDEDEEEAKKRNRNALKYPIKSFIGDMASPAPFLDDFMVWAIDKGIKPFMEPSESEINDAVNEENNIRNIALGKYEMTEDEKEEFIKKYKEDNTFSLESFKNDTGKYGLISVGSDAYEALYESLKMNDGKYTEEFQGKETEKYLTKDQIESQKIFSALKLFHFIGALPREVNQLADKGTRKIKQNSLTKNQYKSYKEFTKVFKREPKPYEIDIIKSTPYVIKEGYTEGSNQKMLENIYNIDQLGGLSNQQGKVYAKLMSTGIEVTPQVYKLIQKGKTVEQIRKFIISN